MQVEGVFAFGSELKKPWTATIGNFDGIHLGHQKLLKTVNSLAKAQDTSSAIISFSPHPRKILFPEQKFEQIYNQSTKTKLLKELGLDVLYNINFNQALATVEPQDFIENNLLKIHPIAKLIVGENFRFGAKAAGDVALLSKICQNAGVGLELVKLHDSPVGAVSSSLVKKLLNEADFTAAAKILGRYWKVAGEIVQDQQLGRVLGFPTANINTEFNLPLANGVYAVKCKLGERELRGAGSYGLRPTVTNSQRAVLEVHLLDFDEDIYGQNLEVTFLKRMRPELKFSSLDELKNAIAKDVLDIREQWSQLKQLAN